MRNARKLDGRVIATAALGIRCVRVWRSLLRSNFALLIQSSIIKSKSTRFRRDLFPISFRSAVFNDETVIEFSILLAATALFHHEGSSLRWVSIQAWFFFLFIFANWITTTGTPKRPYCFINTDNRLWSQNDVWTRKNGRCSYYF